MIELVEHPVLMPGAARVRCAARGCNKEMLADVQLITEGGCLVIVPPASGWQEVVYGNIYSAIPFDVYIADGYQQAWTCPDHETEAQQRARCARNGG